MQSWQCMGGTADYFGCNFYGMVDQVFGVPSSGNGVIGMLGLPNNLYCEGSIQRELIHANLNEPILPCQPYRVTFDLMIAKSWSRTHSISGHQCLDFGFYLYKGDDPSDCKESCGCLSVTPQVSVSASQVLLGDYQTFTLEFIPEDTFDQVVIGPFCNEFFGTSPCVTKPENKDPFSLYFNLDNLHLSPNSEGVILLSDNDVCEGDIVVLTAAPVDSAFAWEWEVPGAVQASADSNEAVFRFPEPGQYDVTLRSTSTCGTVETTYEDTVVVHPEFQDVMVDSSLATCETRLYSIPESNSLLRYRWSDGKEGPTRSFGNSGHYSVTATDEFGCHTSTAAIQVALLSELEVIPNPTTDSWLSRQPLAIPNTLMLYDSGGKLLYKDVNVAQLELKTQELQLASGLYFLTLDLELCQHIIKLVRVR